MVIVRVPGTKVLHETVRHVTQYLSRCPFCAAPRSTVRIFFEKNREIQRQACPHFQHLEILNERYTFLFLSATAAE
jgi:hypothetical protein